MGSLLYWDVQGAVSKRGSFKLEPGSQTKEIQPHWGNDEDLETYRDEIMDHAI